MPSPAARTAVPTTRPIGHRLVGPVRAGVRSLSLVLDLDGEEDPDDIRSDPVRPFGDLAGRRGPAWLRLVIDVLARERPRLSGRKAERWLETSRRDVTTGRHVLCHPDEPDTGLVRRRHARLAHSGDSPASEEDETAEQVLGQLGSVCSGSADERDQGVTVERSPGPTRAALPKRARRSVPGRGVRGCIGCRRRGSAVLGRGRPAIRARWRRQLKLEARPTRRQRRQRRAC